MKSTILLIDGDQFIFKATAALERETQWDDQNHVLYSNVEECWTNLNGMIERIFERFNSREHALCFSKAPNFRKEIDPSYKAGRSPRKPLCYAEMLERVQSSFNCIEMAGLEADDVMGILATKPGSQQKIIVSQDKDMKTIPSTVWDGKDLETITEEEADYFHLYQTLIGDTSDGYKGCPGIGPKTAEKILNDIQGSKTCPECITDACCGSSATTWSCKGGIGCERWPNSQWSAVVAAFERAKLTEADALVQARLARILRWTDWDYENKKPILWTP